MRTTTHGTARSRWARLTALLATLTVALVGLATPALAADTEGVLIPHAITAAKLDHDTAKGVNKGETHRLELTWSVPDTARGGDYFTVLLPAALGYKAETEFDLRNDQDDVVAHAVKAKSDGQALVTFTLTSYADTHSNIGGTAWFEVEINLEGTGEQVVDLGGVSLTVVMTGSAVNYGSPYWRKWVGEKTGYYTAPKRTATWSIYVPVGEHRNLVVVDTPGPGQEFKVAPVIRAFTLIANPLKGGERGYFTDQEVSQLLKLGVDYSYTDGVDEATMLPTRTYTFLRTIGADEAIRINQEVDVVDGRLPSISNRAHLSDSSDVLVAKELGTQLSGGAAWGTGKGMFLLTKVDSDRPELRLSGATFMLTDDHQGTVATFSTGEDGTYLSAQLDKGTYWLVETRAPEGYDVDGTPLRIDVKGGTAIAVVAENERTDDAGTPTDDPSTTPTDEPSTTPTDEPSTTPTDDPGTTPTDDPSTSPTDEPSTIPTDDPSTTLTGDPSTSPTDEPSTTPTDDDTPSSQVLAAGTPATVLASTGGQVRGALLVALTAVVLGAVGVVVAHRRGRVG